MKQTRQKKLPLKLLSIILLILLSACMDVNKNKCVIEARKFSIILSNCEKIKLEEIDENTGRLVFNDEDTVEFTFGILIDKLTEHDPRVVFIPKTKPPIDSMLKLKDSSIIITNNSNFDMDDYRLQNVIYDSVDGYETKIVVPRREKGLVGLYIDSVYTGAIDDLYGSIGFNIYGKNLKKGNRDRLIAGFKTLKFKVN